MFLAARLLRKVGITPSAIYDLESFFWTLVFVLLHHNADSRNNFDKGIWKDLVLSGGTRDYGTDGRVKDSLLTDFRAVATIKPGSVLFPYRDLIRELAGYAFEYNEKPREEMGFEAYSEVDKASAINKCISAFEKFVNELESK